VRGQIWIAAKTIKSHWSGIINYAETKISNGVLKGINSKQHGSICKEQCKRVQNNEKSHTNYISWTWKIAVQSTHLK